MTTLEVYFWENLEKNVTDHRVRCVRGPNGEVDFIIHPDGVDGDTLDFTVEGNRIERVPGGHGAGSRPPKAD